MRTILYITVSITGAVILSLEILGTRILGPYYGVSLYLWSALISVTLLSLSLGYFLGGRVADKRASLERMMVLISAAAIWICLMPLLEATVAPLTQIIGLRVGVLIASVLLFMLPLTLLGMISPIAVKLRATSLDDVGRSAGDLYAISTIASVLSALATGFFLIPLIGVTKLTLGLGVVLLILAMGITILRRRLLYSAALLLMTIVVLLIGFARPSVANYEEIAFQHSTYGDIAVIDRQGARSLYIDGAIHTMVDAETGENELRYGVVMELLDDMTNLEQQMLLIGLGGGALHNHFVDLGWHVDGVEVDPVVIDFATRYFDLRDPESVVCLDGRLFLQNLQESGLYNVILVDAFGSSSIPFHLTTTEAFQLLHSHLKKDGILAINLMTIGWHSKLVNSIATTLHQHFEHVLALPLDEPPNSLGNVILLASNHKIDMPEYWLPRPADFLYDGYLHWKVVQQNHAWDNRFEPDFSRGMILTDDLNPIDLWSEEINFQSRRYALKN